MKKVMYTKNETTFVYAVNKEDLASEWHKWLDEKGRRFIAKVIRDYYLSKTLSFLNKKDYNSIEKLEGLMDLHSELTQGITNI